MKPRVLMSAYACNPRGSGEHWLGWGWAEAAAHSHEVELVTTPKARAAVEEGARAAGIIPHFVDVPEWLRPLADPGWASWSRKLAWQQRVARLARELHQERKISLVHQTTFHTFRVPFLAAGLGIPSVCGPIAGGEHVPPGFDRCLGPARRAEKGRNLANRFWLRTPAVQRSLRQASVRVLCPGRRAGVSGLARQRRLGPARGHGARGAGHLPGLGRAGGNGG
ncbi:MAG TPA: hypothetical protein PKI20_13385 [Verrucomicrobiota bacterium]|jgi:hypothetical protein|nr:hypothetical protein [Verrucomicrobiota bacterium]HQL78673.1 hypothetical protein [Verrucomicrobiota bacterium]